MKFFLVLIGGILAPLVIAQTQENQVLRPSLTIGTSITNYDNVFNDEFNFDTDTAIGINAATSVDQNSTYYRANLSYSVYQRTYLQDSYDNDSGTVGQGNITLGTASSPLKWNIANTEQQTRRETVSTNTPNNQNQRSVVSTGPELSLRLSKVDTLNVSANYQSTTVENSNADIKSDSVNASWNHRINSLNNFGLRANYSDIAPKSNTANNFIQTSYSANYTYYPKQGSLSIDIGQSSVDGFFGLDPIDSETYSILLSKKWGVADVNMGFTQSLSNNGLGDSNIFEYADIGASEELNIEKRRTSHINYFYPALFSNINLALSASQTNAISQTNNADDRIRHGNIEFAKHLPRQFRVRAVYRYTENQTNNGANFTSQFLNSLTISIHKNIGVRFNTDCNLQATQSGGGIVYDTNSIGCNLQYRLL